MLLLKIKRVPEEQGPKSVVIDRNTYGRLLKACNYKTKEELEEEKIKENEKQDKLVVSEHLEKMGKSHFLNLLNNN